VRRLEGKIALITGGAQGIGRFIAELFLAEGACVALGDINAETVQKTARELSEDRNIVRAYRMNVAEESSVMETVNNVEKDFGNIHILVNNAGITRDNLMVRMKKEDWDAVIAVNLTGVFLVSRAVVRGMMKARYGRIINISSVVGVIGNAGQVNYSASKAGVIGVTKTMAKEFASRGITVNAIAPGFIETEMTTHLSEEAKKAFLNYIPLKKPGTPSDVANVALFFASDEAGYITGQVLCVDGGMVM
jgi:3-oxoacyl-[acyl-carrier protein] reductase